MELNYQIIGLFDLFRKVRHYFIGRNEYVTNHTLKASGTDELFYPSCVFTFKDGLITEFMAVRDPEFAKSQPKMWAEFKKWVSKKYPEDYLKLFDAEGKFIRNFENGKRSVKLMNEWRAVRDS